MGWTQFTMHEPIKDWFKKSFEYEGSDYEVIDSSLVKFNHLYGAIRKKSTGQVLCATYLVRFTKAYHYNFMYKDMTEFSGPGIIDCPEKIFKLLTPLNDELDPNGWAREWREKVEKYHKTRKGLKKDCIIHIPCGVTFSSGAKYTHFKKLKFAKEHYHHGAAKKNRYGNTYVPYVKEGGKFVMEETLVHFQPEYYYSIIEFIE